MSRPATAGSVRIGLQFPAHADPADLPRFAEAAESLGYDSLFVVEDCFLAGSIALAAVALQASHRLNVGIGLMPAALRSPAIAAMELATLASIFPGRLRVAFGHGVESWMSQADARPDNRVVALEETISAVRRLLGGEKITVTGRHVRLDAVALDRPPLSPPPVLVGTTGKATLGVASRCADGVLFPEGCGAEFLSSAASTRTDSSMGSWQTVVYAWLAIDDEPRRAGVRLRPAVEGWLAGGLYPAPIRAAGVIDARRIDPEDPALLREIAIYGTPDDCRKAIRRLIDAGADEIVLAPQGVDVQQQIARFATDILPGIER